MSDKEIQTNEFIAIFTRAYIALCALGIEEDIAASMAERLAYSLKEKIAA